MRRLILSLLFLLPTVAIADTLGQDKEIHFKFAGGLATAIYIEARDQGYSKSESYLIGVGTTILAGAFKEAVLDTGWDRIDMRYNVYGAVTVPIIMLWY